MLKAIPIYINIPFLSGSKRTLEEEEQEEEEKNVKKCKQEEKVEKVEKEEKVEKVEKNEEKVDKKIKGKKRGLKPQLKSLSPSLQKHRICDEHSCLYQKRLGFNFCYDHIPENQKCTIKKDDGAPCSYKRIKGLQVCLHHSKSENVQDYKRLCDEHSCFKGKRLGFQYCYNHIPNDQKCVSFNNDGSPCLNKKIKKMNLCVHHANVNNYIKLEKDCKEIKPIIVKFSKQEHPVEQLLMEHSTPTTVVQPTSTTVISEKPTTVVVQPTPITVISEKPSTLVQPTTVVVKQSTTTSKDNTCKDIQVFQQPITNIINTPVTPVTLVERVETIDDNGICKLYTLRNSKKHGEYEEIYPDGQPKIKSLYKEGKKNGRETIWFKNGNKASEIYYIDNIKNGSYIIFDETSGKMQTNGYYMNNCKNGEWTEWYENGNKKSNGHYLIDNKNELWTEWFENSDPKFEELYINGARLTFRDLSFF